LYEFAVNSDLIGRQYALADMRRLTVDGYPAGNDQFFHIAARTQTSLGQHFMQLGRIIIGSQVATCWLLMPSAVFGSSEYFLTSGDSVIVIRGNKTENCISVCACIALTMALIGVLGFLTRTWFATLRFADGRVGAGSFRRRAWLS
jgi:hypothetical protein